MKRGISTIGFLTISILFVSSSCTQTGNETEIPEKIENTLQSVSYLKDTIGHDVQQLLSAFSEFNEVIDSIGYPDAGYKLWFIQDDSSEISYMIEGLWPDQATYDKIHNHPLYQEAWANISMNLDGMSRIEYHRFSLIK